MSPQEQKAKERILNTALSLFAKKGYSAVGVREIAAEANVNIAMISYYFEGKIGILKHIIEIYFSSYHELFKDSNSPDLSAEECLEQLIQKIIYFIKENRELTTTVFNTLPFDIPEIAEIKREYIQKVARRIEDLLKRFDLDSNDMTLISFLGPSIISIILTNFRLRATVESTFNINQDDNYYEQLTHRVTTLLLHGIKGFT